MNNFAAFLTPEEIFELDPEGATLEELHEMAEAPVGDCITCGEELAWRYGQSGMCFTCTTGETDASDDYELVMREVLDGAE